MSSSSNNNNRPSLSNFRHRSLDNVRLLDSINPDATWNRHSTNDAQRLGTQAVHLANRLQHLQINSDISTASAYPSTGNVLTQLQCSRNEALAEEELIERLKEIINEFMTRPDRQYSYNTTMRWTVDHGHQINYSVVIIIKQPSDLS